MNKSDYTTVKKLLAAITNCDDPYAPPVTNLLLNLTLIYRDADMRMIEKDLLELDKEDRLLCLHGYPPFKLKYITKSFLNSLYVIL